MARIAGVRSRNATWFSRVLFFMTRRRLGRVIMPIQITAHHPRLLRAVAHMELGQLAAKSVDARLKMLAQIKVALIIGCPF
ncbi:MAG: hypothetical protein KJZ69_08450 [Phycisphaerales bacterium]|nr:hypothetical protein [Phycisphaerales bacterium]